MSFYPVMLRLDRGIREIGGDGEEITRSSRVMTERGECRGIMAERGRCQVMTIRKGKLVMTTKEKKPLEAVKETSRTTEI